MSLEKTITSHLPSSSLSNLIWKDNKMLPEFREALIRIANDFVDYLGIPIDVLDITMTGSYANYNYTKYSDIDLHVIIDKESINKDTDLVEEFLRAKRSFWNDRHDIELKGIDVELYPQDDSEEHASTGVYSVSEDQWIVKPKKFKDKFDLESVEKGSRKVIKEIEKSIERARNTMDTDPIKTQLDKLKKMRQSGLEKGGEMSNENIIYKVIRSQGLLQKLFDVKDEIYDANLSKI